MTWNSISKRNTLKKRAYNHWCGYARGSTEEPALVEHQLQEYHGQPFKMKLIEVTPTNRLIDRKATEAVKRIVRIELTDR